MRADDTELSGVGKKEVRSCHFPFLSLRNTPEKGETATAILGSSRRKSMSASAPRATARVATRTLSLLPPEKTDQIGYLLLPLIRLVSVGSGSNSKPPLSEKRTPV